MYYPSNYYLHYCKDGVLDIRQVIIDRIDDCGRPISFIPFQSQSAGRKHYKFMQEEMMNIYLLKIRLKQMSEIWRKK